MDQKPNPRFARCTAGRIERFYSLMCRLGFDTLFDDLQRQEDAEFDAPRPVTADNSQNVQAEEPAVLIKINFAHLMRSIMEHKALTELAGIVLDVEPAEAGDVEQEEIAEALLFFVPKALAPMRLLASFGSALG